MMMYFLLPFHFFIFMTCGWMDGWCDGVDCMVERGDSSSSLVHFTTKNAIFLSL